MTPEKLQELDRITDTAFQKLLDAVPAFQMIDDDIKSIARNAFKAGFAEGARHGLHQGTLALQRLSLARDDHA